MASHPRELYSSIVIAVRTSNLIQNKTYLLSEKLPVAIFSIFFISTSPFSSIPKTFFNRANSFFAYRSLFIALIFRFHLLRKLFAILFTCTKQYIRIIRMSTDKYRSRVPEKKPNTGWIISHKQIPVVYLIINIQITFTSPHGLASSPGLTMWDLWWAKRHWDFS